MAIDLARRVVFVAMVVSFFSFMAIAEQNGVEGEESTQRWYTSDQVDKGKQLYVVNCISCHLEDASGTTDWKKTLDDGSYPPPPLNGTAHAWHHSIDTLKYVIQEGGKPFGGKMPPFKDTLNEQEQLAVIAYFQSFWSEEIYLRWLKIEEQTRNNGLIEP